MLIVQASACTAPRTRRAARCRALAAIAAAALPFAVASGAAAPQSATPGRIAYASGGSIYVIAADGSRPRAIARGDSPSWSPDGRQLAFDSARVPGNGLDIYVMNADGSHQRLLVTHFDGSRPANNTADDFDPAWAPNDTIIAFVTQRDGNDEVYSMNWDGHSVSRLTNSPASDRQPAWSPAGREIAFVSDRDGNDEIYSMSDAGTDVRRLSRDPAADQAPAWSPDGRAIAFQSSRDGNWEIYVMGADGNSPRRLTSDPSPDTRPSWSPDGKNIVFTSGAGLAGSRLAVVDVESGGVRALTAAGAEADRAAWQPAVDLALTISGDRVVRRGGTARLRVALSALVPQPAFSVVVRSSLPRGLRLTRVRASAGRCSISRGLRCSVRRLTSPSTVSFDVTLRATRCGSRAIRVSVSSTQMELDARNNSARARLSVRC
jgi:Tol biopolymer transport system component